MTAPRVGQTVHYVSYGTPGGEYKSQCRAAIVTAACDCEPADTVDLAVLNPEGMFFNRGVEHHGTAEKPGDPDCPDAHAHGSGPFRYCPCGWAEATPRGGTWHSLDNCSA